MIHHARPVLVFLVALLSASPALSQESLFEEGNRYYQNGEFEDALAKYNQVLEAGYTHGAL